MEKLVYIVWRPETVSVEGFKDSLLGGLSQRFEALGVRKLALNIVDESATQVQQSRITKLDPPPAGAVSFWLDSVDRREPYEVALAECCSRFEGYLVEESRPVENATHRAALGERTPGITMLALIERPESMSHEAWIAHWHGHHQKVAIETQCTYLYTRNVVIRALTPNAPPWEGIVEEGFPVEAVTDPMIWYCAEGSPEKLKENLDRMLESCRAFLDLGRVESHPTSEYRMKE